MNDVMSAGTHRLWKHRFVNQLNLSRGMKILDMAGGTGSYSEIINVCRNLISYILGSSVKFNLCGLKNFCHWQNLNSEKLLFSINQVMKFQFQLKIFDIKKKSLVI